MKRWAERLTSTPITGEEIAQWFRKHQQPWPEPADCERLALRMNRMARLAAATPEYMRFAASNLPPPPEREWWDFTACDDAVDVLTESLPAMLAYWSVGHRIAPMKIDGTKAIKLLQEALIAATPYIKHPFGTYDPVKGKKEVKLWHTAAIAIYPEVGAVLCRTGHTLPSTISKDTIWAKVTFRALQRLELPDAAMTGLSAVASYLVRWQAKDGMTAKHIAALCNQDAGAD